MAIINFLGQLIKEIAEKKPKYLAFKVLMIVVS